jgi:plastocyanin
MKTCKQLSVVLLSVGVLVAAWQRASATDWTVVQGPTTFTFNPATLTIGQGDTVTWTNASALTAHTTTSGTVAGVTEQPDQLWNGSNPGFGTYKVDFTGFAPRTYPYYCIPHASFGMVGSITVTGAQVQPMLKNVAAAPGTKVQFHINGLIGETNIVESSADLVGWSPVSTNLALATDTAVTNLPANASPQGFYRVRLGP